MRFNNDTPGMLKKTTFLLFVEQMRAPNLSVLSWKVINLIQVL